LPDFSERRKIRQRFWVACNAIASHHRHIANAQARIPQHQDHRLGLKRVHEAFCRSVRRRPGRVDESAGISS
jgi:hypothetical protein